VCPRRAELRDIVRRIHPPALDDGLATALSTLAARSGLPVEVTIDLREPPPDALATTVYFTTAELLSNAARHAGAARVRMVLTEDNEWLRLVVTDDGPGGAAPNVEGTGLAGLASRARGLDGRFDAATVRPPPNRDRNRYSARSRSAKSSAKRRTRQQRSPGRQGMRSTAAMRLPH
jgi:signal transduction histidine kinase